MQIDQNIADGETVLLNENESLDVVPVSHLHLLTPALREAFADPRKHFLALAERCPFPNMATWLRLVATEGGWLLHLALGDPEIEGWALAGFTWAHAEAMAAIIRIPDHSPPDLPQDLWRYYSLVDAVQWQDFGYGGGMYGAHSHTPLTSYAHYAEGKPDADRIRIWGGSLGGDMLIYSLDNRGGWLCHETGEIHWMGTIADTINWVFGEMLEGREPDFNYDWLRKKK